MGRWATYIVGADGEDHPAAHTRHGGTAEGWAWWELPAQREETWDPGPGHTLIAHVYDSDAVVIHGLDNREPRWQWTFGESSAAFYEGRDVDDLELEETLPARAAEASTRIAGWAADAGLPGVDPGRLADLLQQGHPFAEGGFVDLVEALSIVVEDSTAEPRELTPTLVQAEPKYGDSVESQELAESAVEQIPPRFWEKKAESDEELFLLTNAAAFELAMGAELMDQADEAADWMELVRSTIFLPLAKAWTGRGAQVDYGQEPFISPYALQLTAVFWTSKRRIGSAKPDDRGWARLMKRLRAGDLAALSLHATVATEVGQANAQDVPLSGLSLGVTLAADHELDSIPAQLYGQIPGEFAQFAQPRFLKTLVDSALEEFPVVSGWVDYTRGTAVGSGRSSYERAVTRSGFSAKPDPRTKIRRPAWRLLIGPGHLEALGGREELEGSRLFAISQVNDTLLLLQCGRNPVDCTSDHREAMAALLAPVLPNWRDQRAAFDAAVRDARLREDQR